MAQKKSTAKPIKTISAGEEDFVYEYPAGKITLPNFGRALSASEVRKHQDMDTASILFYVLERDKTEAELAEIDAILDTVPGIELGNLIAAWQEHARVTMGESSAS